MPELKVARPFRFRGADHVTYEFGIALYDGLSQEFVDDPWVQAHTEAAVLARGGLLFQQRIVNDGLHGVPIFLDASNAHLYSGGIQSGFDPLFRDDLDVDLGPALSRQSKFRPLSGSIGPWAGTRRKCATMPISRRTRPRCSLATVLVHLLVARRRTRRSCWTVKDFRLRRATSGKHLERTAAIRRMQQAGRARAAKEESVR